MTGGQMAPTTLLGQKTTTTPAGRDRKEAGSPVRVSEMLAVLDGPAYIERVSVDSPKNVLAAKRAIRKAFQNQLDGKGFSLVEVLSMCPTDWGMTPVQAIDWVRKNMMSYYPLGVYKDGETAPRPGGKGAE
jgi:2-oxoglutarate ferredoxin oxidoreductase subunit beta